MEYNVFSAYFDRPEQNGRLFRRMAGVLRESVEDNCPDAIWSELDQPQAPKVFNQRQNVVANITKLVGWRNFIREADKPTLLIDADTLVLQDLGDIWEEDFDLAYCERPGPFPIIGGVIFVQNTDAAKAFMDEWYAVATSIFLNVPLCQQLVNIFGGISQTTLNVLLRGLDKEVIESLKEKQLNIPPKLEELFRSGYQDDLDKIRLDSEIWNLCDENWHKYDPEHTRIVHFKGPLRRELTCGDPGKLEKYDHQSVKCYAPLIKLWNQYCNKYYDRRVESETWKEEIQDNLAKSADDKE